MIKARLHISINRFMVDFIPRITLWDGFGYTILTIGWLNLGLNIILREGNE